VKDEAASTAPRALVPLAALLFCALLLQASALWMDRVASDYTHSHIAWRNWIHDLFRPLEDRLGEVPLEANEDARSVRSTLFMVWWALACPAYFGALWLVRRRIPEGHRGALALILLGAALFRFTLVPFPPLMETSFARYVWDGVVVARGINPYKFSPEEVKKARDPKARLMYSDPERTELLVLSIESRTDVGVQWHFENSTYPQLRTIYPPMSQLMWGMCAAFAPGNPWVVKGVNAVIDIGVVLLILLLLVRIGANPNMVIAYAWCPLVLKEFSNSGHGDVLALFFVTLAMVYLIGQRPLLAAAALAGGALVKLYPLALAAVFWRKLGRPGLVLMGGLVFLGVLPMLSVKGFEQDGLAAYARRWEHNGSLYPMLRTVMLKVGLEKEPKEPVSTWSQNKREDYSLPARASASRVVAGLSIIAILLWLSTRRQERPRQILGCAFAGIATVQLFSPVLLPWYFTWCLPFLAIFPLSSFLYLSASVAAGWYGVHALDSSPDIEKIKALAQVLEYAPFYALLYLEWRKGIVTSRDVES
jgi:hypothetical protein